MTRILAIIVCAGMLGIGFYFNLEYYQNTIYPINITVEILEDVIGSSDPVMINDALIKARDNLTLVIEVLPQSKNPVWMFPAESTNVQRMKDDVTQMVSSIERISDIPKDSSAYHTGMMDIRYRAELIRENIADMQGFLYASPSNIFFTLVWSLGVVGLSMMWIRK